LRENIVEVHVKTVETLGKLKVILEGWRENIGKAMSVEMFEGIFDEFAASLEEFVCIH
jgi:hypothetical protein